ncbi:uncharacterized protein LOC142165070 [Nicotiana tabacum]|uniref:Uncharacterized protein LOC142165070 n=1 Tax=Nicotiana tabacum TaxID=4097 RepID=A0AC58S488_TOBAC
MGFTERLIGIVFGLVSNNWYSILINGQAHGFFKSSRGVKQGDPVSPTLFILAAEALSRGLNALHTNLYFCGFGMPKWSPKINYLAHADDMIIFSSSDETSLMLIMQVLNAYEAASGQLVNKTKSVVHLHHLTDMEVVSKVERIIGIQRNDFPIIYLGCPIFYAKRKLEYYQPLITKVMDKLQSWQGKLLSVGGRAVLISHVLQNMSMHLLSAVNPPNYVINRLPKLFAQFFWSSSVGGTSRHWALWNSLCMPVEEGGIVPQDFGIDETVQYVHEVTLDGEWDMDRLFEMLPEDLAVHILEKIKPPSPQQVLGMPCWMLETRGYFSVKSVWDYTKRRDEPRTAYRMIWVKGLPFKIAFFMWKVWKAKLPLDAFLKRVGYCMPSKCWCCVQPDEESLQHLFFRSETARTTWKYFLSRAGIVVEGLTLHQAITKCWTANVCLRLKPGDLSSFIKSPGIGESEKAWMDMVAHKWQDLLPMMENFTHKLKVTKVMWEFPSAGWVKVNTDGASRGNPGRSSISFCIRNENGDIVKSVGREIEETTNTIMNGIWKPPWIISEQVEEMMQLMNEDNYTVTHIHREGNKLTDHLANYALDHGEIECQHFWHLDAQGRRLVNEDKLQCPSLRVKVDRR